MRSNLGRVNCRTGRLAALLSVLLREGYSAGFRHLAGEYVDGAAALGGNATRLLVVMDSPNADPLDLLCGYAISQVNLGLLRGLLLGRFGGLFRIWINR